MSYFNLYFHESYKYIWKITLNRDHIVMENQFTLQFSFPKIVFNKFCFYFGGYLHTLNVHTQSFLDTMC